MTDTQAPSPRRRTRAGGAIAVAALLMAMVVSGCGSDSSSSSGAGERTLTVRSAGGSVQVPAQPKAALGMYTTDVDILITLGIPLAKAQPVRGDLPTKKFPSFFPQDALKGITSFANFPNYNYERMAAARPDFILNGLGYDKAVVKRLPSIAPTLSLDAFDGRNWREHFKETATKLGRMPKYEAWVKQYDARLAEVKRSIGDKADGLVVAPISVSDKRTVRSACYTGVECAVFDDLGLKVLPAARRKNGKGVQLSYEQLGQLSDLDLGFFIGPSNLARSSTELAAVSQNRLWRNLPFVRNKGIVGYPLEVTFGSPSGQMEFLDVVERAFAKRRS